MTEFIIALNATPVDRLLFYGLICVLSCYAVSVKIKNFYITNKDDKTKE